MNDLPHLRIEGTARTFRYVYAGQLGGERFQLPPRVPSIHSKKLKAQLEAATKKAEELREGLEAAVDWQPDGIVLTFVGEPGFDLKLDSLEKRRSQIHLLSVCVRDGCQVAKVFVPHDKVGTFLKLLDEYETLAELTFIVHPKNLDGLTSMGDEDKEIKFLAPSYAFTDDKKKRLFKVRFRMPEAEVVAFKRKVGSVATLHEEGRKNQKLIASIASIRLTLIEDFYQDTAPFPSHDKEIWWEVWLRAPREEAEAIHQSFRRVARSRGIQVVSERYVAFPERLVLYMFTSARSLSQSIDVLATLAELRQGKELATHYVTLSGREQAEFVREAVGRIRLPGKDAPCVTIIDGGVHRGHILLAPALHANDCHAVKSSWGVHDTSPIQHGTEMAGIALFGCLTEVLGRTDPIVLTHRLESVKILPPPPAMNEPPDYGARMQDGVALAHIKAAKRNRVLCMAVTADHAHMGVPTLWSAAVDDMCAGVLDQAPKLMFISAGNVREHFDKPEYKYHEWNTTQAAIEDPAQAWNALTVGAVTEKVQIQEAVLKGWTPIAEAGDLCPTSRTSLPWPDEHQTEWPIKPDICMEGGNYACKGNRRSNADDLSLLTTFVGPNGRLLDTMQATSPATANAARLAAILWNRYPKLRPETVRALIVHSARWNKKMMARIPGSQKISIHRRLRCYGYGVPDIRKAINSAENAVTLIYEGELQPFKKGSKGVKTNDMHIHTVPWPLKALEDLGENRVAMRLTLSYFVEPSPGGIGWKEDHRYQSHGLRFDVIRPNEDLEENFSSRMGRPEAASRLGRRVAQMGCRQEWKDTRVFALRLVGRHRCRTIGVQQDRNLSRYRVVEGASSFRSP